MSQSIYLFGKHACASALANPSRKIRRVLVTEPVKRELGVAHKNLTISDNAKIAALLPKDAVHQGIALEAEALEQPSLQEWLAEDKNQPVVLLDQVEDPHNVGAILRSSAAFDAGCVVVTDRHAPKESAVMAKAASGALETVPLIAVSNLAQALEVLKKAGYWIYGLDGSAKESIANAKFDSKTALVLGAEGEGMRRLTTEHCDFLVKLPMSNKMESLNVSNAAAVALYEMYRKNSV